MLQLPISDCKTNADEIPPPTNRSVPSVFRATSHQSKLVVAPL